MNKEQVRVFFLKMLMLFGALALSIILYFVIKNFDSLSGIFGNMMYVLRPFVYGGVIAYLLKPVCKWYERVWCKVLPVSKKKLGESLAVTFSILTGLIIIAVLVVIIIPNLFQSVMSLYNTLPGKVEALVIDIRRRLEGNEVFLNYFNMAYDAISTKLSSWVSDSLLPQMSVIISGIGNGVKNVVNVIKDLFIGIIVAIYFLGSRKKFAKQGKLILYSLVKEKPLKIFLDELGFADKMFTGFIAGKIIDSTIIGVICYVFCVISKMPNGILVSVIVGITNIIPFFGPYIGGIPSLLLICIDSPMKALWFLIFIIILQQVDGNILGPKILGNSTGLSSFWVLFSILLFGGFFGIVGMFVGVPLFAVIYDIIKKLVIRGLRRHDCSYMMSEYEMDL